MFTKAIQFLECVIPDITQYLRLWEESEEAEDGIERFNFSVYVNGIPAEYKHFMININAENGAVMHYSGESSKFIKITYIRNNTKSNERRSVRNIQRCYPS